MRIRSYYNYVPRAISRPNVVLSAIHRESLARFAMLMTAGWHLAGIWKYAKACSLSMCIDHVFRLDIQFHYVDEKTFTVWVTYVALPRIFVTCFDRFDRSEQSRRLSPRSLDRQRDSNNVIVL